MAPLSQALPLALLLGLAPLAAQDAMSPRLPARLYLGDRLVAEITD